ncbi:unnamed protein product [Absidia cylindrospora]
MPHNTADYDAPLLKTTVTVTTHHLFLSWLDNFYFILRMALLVLALSFIYQVFSCIELKPMPTERLYAVDPDAPTHVWVPVFQWTCWKHAWVGKYPTSALWILGATIGLAWLHRKRR